jgi:hypothetical protein
VQPELLTGVSSLVKSRRLFSHGSSEMGAGRAAVADPLTTCESFMHRRSSRIKAAHEPDVLRRENRRAGKFLTAVPPFACHSPWPFTPRECFSSCQKQFSKRGILNAKAPEPGGASRWKPRAYRGTTLPRRPATYNGNWIRAQHDGFPTFDARLGSSKHPTGGGTRCIVVSCHFSFYDYEPTGFDFVSE